MTALELVAEPGMESDAALDAAHVPSPTLRVDLSGVDHLDPATIRTLLRWTRRVRDLGVTIAVTDPGGALERTLEVLVHDDPRTSVAREGTPACADAPVAEKQ